MDSGLLPGGTSVVDLDTKVYGTENLFVVDASIMLGMTTSNPSGAIVAVAERAVERILALDSSGVEETPKSYDEGYLARCKGDCVVQE